jgi:hypothetical protein
LDGCLGLPVLAEAVAPPSPAVTGLAAAAAVLVARRLGDAASAVATRRGAVALRLAATRGAAAGLDFGAIRVVGGLAVFTVWLFETVGVVERIGALFTLGLSEARAF